ncbi:hypothetical protein [Helicobacter anatolicus]|uniref:hypothetical protein n=1 Tax=Helicobacter anatolicus TaxID=2905874 RepID=UPI001E32E4AB|nr:hypothetical protein [Helicobacter anatolicus]
MLKALKPLFKFAYTKAGGKLKSILFFAHHNNIIWFKSDSRFYKDTLKLYLMVL